MSVVEKVRATLGAYGSADIRSELHEDHKRIQALAKELAEATTMRRRRTLVNELKPFLTAHARSEEAVVYQPMIQLRDSADSRALGNEGLVEHNLVEIILTRLAQTPDASSGLWQAHAKVLHELLKHHIEEEEHAIFEELGEHFDSAGREAMRIDFVDRRDKFLRLNKPRGSARKRAIVASV